MAHQWVRERLRDGDVAVDATAGNGKDSAFLADCVGRGGKVYAFDIQPEAILSAREELAKVGMLERVQLIEGDHAEMGRKVPPGDNIRAVMFNLGYLPGGDKHITTRGSSTILALGAALDLVAAGGILTVVIYTGHPEGKEEALAVEAWADVLPPGFGGIRYTPVGRKDAPYLLAITRNGGR